jgi:hypothetical protein
MLNGFARAIIVVFFIVTLPLNAVGQEKQPTNQPALGGLIEDFRFAGFIENATSVCTSHGHRHWNQSNSVCRQRLTLLPEFAIDLPQNLDLFISWRFVKEIRYLAEDHTRRNNVPPQLPLGSTFYDEDSPKPWEGFLNYSPTSRLSFRLGKQFISWGETDGLRLLDVINPQDGTFTTPAVPNLFDTDETRIPLFALRAFYTLPLQTDSKLEFFVVPGFDEAKKRVDESAPASARWAAHPETRIGLGNLFATAPGPFIPSVSREFPDAGNNERLGARFVQTIGKATYGLGYIYTFNPQSTDLTFKVLGTSPCGPPACPPGGTLVRLRLANDRTHIFAGHLSFDVDAIQSTLRSEVAFYPSMPHNISKYPGPGGTRAGLHPRHPDGRVEKNVLRYSIGLDRNTFIPFLHPDDPWRPFLTSFQLFQSVIFAHEDGIRFFATAEKINKVSNFLTVRINTGYLNDTILPDLFVGYDPEGYWVANPAVSYVPPWNEKMKISLIGAFYGGHNKFKSMGAFDEKDNVTLKLRYQF